MNRAIKFRIWDGNFIDWDFASLIENYGIFSFTELLNEETLMVQQYTGLKDENGKEIYEGDILEVPWDFDPSIKLVGMVIYWEGAFRLAKGKTTDEEFKELWPYDCFSDNDTPSRRYNWKNGRIIGNIFENPELLK